MCRDTWTYIFESTKGENRLGRFEANGLFEALHKFARSHGFDNWWDCETVYRVKSMHFDNHLTATTRLIWLGKTNNGV